MTNLARTATTVVLGLGVIGLSMTLGSLVNDMLQAREDKRAEMARQEQQDVTPLNGVFQCEYYKTTNVMVEGVVNYTVTDAQAGWNWMIELDDGTAMFFTQGRDKICYVRHVEE